MKNIEHRNHSCVAAARARARRAGSPRRGRRAAARFAAIAACVAGALAIAAPTAGASGGPAPYPASAVTLVGHGWGPAWGLGQWGAFGYAARYDRTSQWLLTHYYPGTTPAVLSQSADRRIVRVAVEENAGHPMVVTSASAFHVTSGTTTLAVPAGEAVRAVLSVAGASKGTWALSEAGSCGAKRWTPLAKGLTDPTAVPASSSPSAPASQLLQLCRADGSIVTYRGDLEAYDYDSSGTGGAPLARTLSLVPLEEYVADVTPTESPAGWGSLPSGSAGPQGEAYGFQELEAQAVAVRTYVLAEIASGGWYGYADICDDVCQGYFNGAGYENPLTTLAAEDTAGQVLLLDGSPAPTQYAASSGGYTGGSPAFKPVPDSGDAVCLKDAGGLGCNPWHTWTASVPVSQVEKAFPSVGTLADVKVVSRNKLGAFGGRVLEIEMVGTSGATVTVTGNTWVADFGLDSNWFAITNGPSATASPPPSTAGGSGRRPGIAAGPGRLPPVPPVGSFAVRVAGERR